MVVSDVSTPMPNSTLEKYVGYTNVLPLSTQLSVEGLNLFVVKLGPLDRLTSSLQTHQCTEGRNLTIVGSVLLWYNVVETDHELQNVVMVNRCHHIPSRKFKLVVSHRDDMLSFQPSAAVCFHLL